MCGGAGCGSIDMNLITPTVVGDVPDDAKSSAYCCTTGVDARDVICGTGDGQAYPPCFIPVGESSGWPAYCIWHRSNLSFCCWEAVVIGSRKYSRKNILRNR